MNWTFVVGTYGANPVHTAAIRHCLHIRPALMHAEDDRATRAPLREVLAAKAVAIRLRRIEQTHVD
jgi:hypothetical protein